MHNDGVTVSTFQFLKRFNNEDAARNYIEKLRWNGKPDCPQCHSVERIQARSRKGYYRCLICVVDFTVRTGTVMERSHVPLDKWLYAMYLMATARKGVSSLQLSKEVGVTQKTAWFILQRLRESCGGPDDMPQLSGLVEVDETFLGGKEMNKHANRKLKAGRGTVGKTAVLGLRERGGALRAQVITGTGKKIIHAKVRSSVAAGATLYTDEHSAYVGMGEFAHRSVNHSAKQFVDGMAHTNSVESVWAVLKRGYYGVYHSFSEKHMQRYLNEFTFRLNEGNCKNNTMDRIESLVLKTVRHRLTYRRLVD